MRPEKRVGRVIADRYQLERLIGRGGMGAVYAGTHTWTERPVAVKVLLPAFADDAKVRRRFFQEAKVQARVRHPNVVDVLDMGEDDDGSAFIVMELLEGESLRARLEARGALPFSEAFDALDPVMHALELAHGLGIVHRDLKPDNVFLAAGLLGGTVPKLLDFGVAKLMEGSDVVTKTGSMMGTPAYMSPEQAKGESTLGPACDVYGMGVVWFRALSGRVPLSPNPNPTMMMVELITQPRPSLGSVTEGLSDEVVQAVDRALEREPGDRFASMAAFRHALRPAARSSTTRAAPTDTVPG